MAENIITPENQGEGVAPAGRKLIGTDNRKQHFDPIKIKKGNKPDLSRMTDAELTEYTRASRGNAWDSTEQEDLGSNPYNDYNALDHPAFFPGGDFAKQASDEQSSGQQAVNAIVGGTMNGLIKAIEAFSYLPNIITRDWEKTTFQEQLGQAQDGINASMPVYSDPNNPLSWDSSMFWGGVKGVIESGLQFALPGGVISKGVGAVNKGLSMGARSVMALNGPVGAIAEGIAANTSRGVNALMEGMIANPSMRTSFIEMMSSMPAGIIQNQLEGTIMGMEMYDRKVQELRDAGETDEAFIKAEASRVANDMRYQNQLMVLKDAWELKTIFGKAKPGVQALTDQSRILPRLSDLAIWKKDVWKAALKGGKSPLMLSLGEAGEEMFQGGMEDNIMNESNARINEKLGFDYFEVNKDRLNDGWLNSVLKYSFTDQNIFEGMMGFFGGGFQNAISNIPGKVIDNKNHKRLSKELSEVNDLILESTDDNEKEALRVKAKQIEFEIGNTLKGHYEAQQARLEENTEILQTKFDNLFDAQELYDKALYENDEVTKELIEDNLFTKGAMDNLKKGTLANFRQTIEEIANGTEQAQQMLGEPITDDIRTKARKMADKLNEIETEWNRHSDPILGERKFYVAENKKMLNKSSKAANDKLSETKNAINDQINNYNNAEKAVDPNHLDLPNIDELIKTKGDIPGPKIDADKQTRIDELKAKRKAKGIVGDDIKELKELEAEKDKIENAKSKLKAAEFLNDENLQRATTLVDNIKKSLDNTLEEETYLNSAQYTLWKDKINAFLSKNATNLTSDKVDSVKNDLEKIVTGVNSRNRLSEAGKQDLLGQLNRLKLKVLAMEKAKKDAELFKAAEELRQQKINEFLMPFIERAKKGNGYFKFSGKSPVYAHIQDVTSIDEDGEIVYRTDTDDDQYLPYMTIENSDGTFTDGFEDLFLEGDIIEVGEDEYLQYVNFAKKKKKPAATKPTKPTKATKPAGKATSGKRPYSKEPDFKEPGDIDPTDPRYSPSKGPDDLTDYTDIDIIGGKVVEVGEDGKPVTPIVSTGTPVEKKTPKKKSPVVDEIKFEQPILDLPAISVSYNSREFIQDTDGNVRNASDDRILKPIDTQQYSAGTKAEVVVSESDMQTYLFGFYNETDLPIQIRFEGDKDFENQSFVPTMAGLLSTEGSRDASMIGYFAAQDEELSDENNRYLSLTKEGKAIIELIKKYNAKPTIASRNAITKLLEKAFKNSNDINPFTRMTTYVFNEDKQMVRDLSKATDQLIELYNNRVEIIKAAENDKTTQAVVSRILPGSVARRVSNATQDTENTNLVPLSKMIKETGVRVVQVGETTKINVLEIPMKRNIADEPVYETVNFQANPVNKELIYAFIEDYITSGPITKDMNKKSILRILNTVWSYDFKGTYLDFDLDVANKRRQIVLKHSSKEPIYILSKNLKDDKLTASQKKLINAYIGDDIAPVVKLDITSNVTKQSIKLNKGKLALIKKISNLDLIINNSSTDILYVKDKAGNWIFHEQATYQMDYNPTTDQRSGVVERDDVKPVEPKVKKTRKKKEVKPTEPEAPAEETVIPDDNFSIRSDERASIKTDPVANRALLDKYSITYNKMPFLIQQELVNDMVSRIIRRFNGSATSAPIINIKDNLASVKNYYLNILAPANKGKNQYLENMDKYYDQLQNLAISKVQSMGLKLKFESQNDKLEELEATDYSGEAGKIAAERYDDSIFELNDYDRPSFRLKSKLSLIETGKSSLGFTTYLDGENAFITIKRLLANKPNLSFNEQMDYLETVENQNIHLKEIVKLAKSWDKSTQNEFKTVFTLYKNSTGIMLWNTKDGKYNANIIDADRNSGGRMMVEQWQSDFLAISNDPSNNLVIDTPEHGFMINAERMNEIRDEFEQLATAYNTEEEEIREATKSKAKPVSLPYATEITRLLNELMIDVKVEDINFMMDNPTEYTKIGEDYYRNNIARLFDLNAGIIGILFNNIGKINLNNAYPVAGIKYIPVIDYNPFTAGGNYYANLGRYISSIRGNQMSDSAIDSNGNMKYSYTIFDHLTNIVAQIKSDKLNVKELSAFAKGSSWLNDPSFDIKIMDSMKHEEDNEHEEAYNLQPVEIELENLGGIQNNGNDSRLVNGPTNSDKSRYVKFKMRKLADSDQFLAENIENNAVALISSVLDEGERMRQYAALRNGKPDDKTINGKTGNKQFDNGFKYFYLLPTANMVLAKEKLTELIAPMLSAEALDDPKTLAVEITDILPVYEERYLDGFDTFKQDVVYSDMLNEPDLAHFIMLASQDAVNTNWEITFDELIDKIIANNYDISSEIDTAIPHNKNGFISLLAANKYNEEVQQTLNYWKNNNIDSSKMDSKWKAKLIGDGENIYDKGKFRKFTATEIVEIAAREAVSYSQHTSLQFYKLIAGDPASFYKGGSNGKLSDLTAEQVSNNINATLVETVKRNAKNLASGSKPNFKILKFNEGTKNYEWVQQKTYTTATINDNERASYNEDILNNPILAEMYGEGKINVADALEYTTFEEHLHVMFAKGTPNLNDALYETLLRKARVQDRLRWNQPVPAEAELTKDELKFVFGMMKPVQVSNLKFKSTGAQGALYNTQLEYYVKSSSMPLIHQVFSGLEVNKLKDGMMYFNNKIRPIPIDRLAHKSAVKGGAVRVANLWEDGVIKGNLDNIYPVELSRDGFYIQQEIPYKELKNEILIMSQMDKLVLEGFKQFDTKGLIAKKERIKKDMFAAAKADFINRFGVIDHGNGTYSFSSMERVIEILKKEAFDRGFSKNAIEYLQLDENGQLVTPMFFNSAANKYESLMTSIASKIVLQHVHGHSYVQTSSSGVKTLGQLSDKHKNDIILIKGHTLDKELPFITLEKDKKTGKPTKINPAGVYVPFQFLSNEIKAKDGVDGVEQTKLSPKDFTITVNGETYIDSNKLDYNLLNLIGGRIPGQGPNSMLPIKILGFLPEYMGNTIVVPAEIAVQMGSDFDVDKLYTYMWNYTYNDKTKTITKYNPNAKAIGKANKQAYEEYQTNKKDIQDKINKLFTDNKDTEAEIRIIEIKEQLSDLDFELRNMLSHLNSLLSGDITADEQKEADLLMPRVKKTKDERSKLITELRSFGESKKQLSDLVGGQQLAEQKELLYQSFLKQKQDNEDSIIEAKDKKSLQNEYFDVHWEVLTNHNMFVRIAESLDMTDIANEFTKVQSTKEPLGLISPLFNRQSFLENRAGKQGIAIEANSIVFNSMIQGLRISVQSGLDKISIPINIGSEVLSLNILGEDALSLYMNKNNRRRIHKNIQNIQSEAVDNAKYGRLGALNFNNDTFNAINAMLMLSDDMKKPIGEDGTEVGAVANDHVVALMTQEVIKSYIDSKAKAFNQHSKNKYSKYEESKLKDLMLKNYYELAFGIPFTGQGIRDTLLATLEIPSVTELTNARNLDIKVASEDEARNYYKTQLQALVGFFALDEIGGLISGTQKAVDASTKGVGKSFIDSLFKEQLYNDRILTSNYTSSYFKFNLAGTGQLADSEYGNSVEQGVLFANRVFNSLFPYKNLFSTVSQYFANERKQLDEKDYREIINYYKAYIFANDALYTTSVETERRRLLFGATNIFDRVIEAKKTVGEGTYLLNGIVVEQDASKSGVRRLRYAAGKTQRVDEEFNTISLLQMLESEDKNTRDLGNDLITYSFLTNPVQSANNFMMYIPSSIILNDKINGYLNEQNINLINNNINYESFIEQYIRNRPSMASQMTVYGDEKAIIELQSYKKYNSDLVKLQAENNDPLLDKTTRDQNNARIEMISTQLNRYFRTGPNPVYLDYDEEVNVPKFLNITFVIDKKMNYTKDVLFKSYKDPKSGGYTLKAVSTLGSFENKQMNSSQLDMDQNIDLTANKVKFDAILGALGFKKDSTAIGPLMEKIMKFGSPAHVETARLLKDVLANSEYTVNIDYNGHNPAGINHKNKTININPNLENKFNPANKLDDFISAVIHEAQHISIDQAISDYYNNPSALTEAQFNSIKRLDVLRKDVIREIKKDAAQKKEFENFMKNYIKRLRSFNNKGSKDNQIKEANDTLALVTGKINNSIYTSDDTITDVEKSMYYGLVNVNEFITMAWSDDTFQEELNNYMPSKEAKKGFLQRLVDAFQNLFKALYDTFNIQVNEDSILAYTLAESYKLITSTSEGSTTASDWSADTEQETEMQDAPNDNESIAIDEFTDIFSTFEPKRC